MEKIICLQYHPEISTFPHEKDKFGVISYSTGVKFRAEQAWKCHYSACRSSRNYSKGSYDTGLTGVYEFISTKVKIEISTTHHYGRRPDMLAVRVESSDEKILSEVMNSILTGHWDTVSWSFKPNHFSIQEAQAKGIFTPCPA